MDKALSQRPPNGLARQAKCGGLRRVTIEFRMDPRIYDKLKRCATLVLSDYNSQMNTNYRFIDLAKADSVWGGSDGPKYCIRFQASTCEELNTFRANVRIRKIQRGVRSLRVDGFQIEKPGSIWRDGFLLELAAIGKRRRSFSI